MVRRKREYFRKVFEVSELVRYDLKVMDYGLGERYVLKKYIKQQDGRWSGEAGSKIIVDSVSDEEVPQMLKFMIENIMDVRREQKENERQIEARNQDNE